MYKRQGEGRKKKKEENQKDANTDQEEPDDDPGRKENSDQEVKGVIHTFAETKPPGANQRGAKNA